MITERTVDYVAKPIGLFVMGSNRKKSHHGSSGSKKGTIAGGNTPPSSSANDDVAGTDLDAQLLDAPLLISWREIWFIVGGLLLVGLLSISIGISARLFISIHYYEPESSHLNVEEDGFGDVSEHLLNQRTTLWDPSIARQSIHDVEHDPLRSTLPSDAFPFVQENPLHKDKSERQLKILGGSSSKKKEVMYPRLSYEEMARIKPKLCSDGITYGYDTWNDLQKAIQDANAFSAEHFVRWNEFFATSGDLIALSSLDDPNVLYEQEIHLTICPGAKLRSKSGPIFVNAENIFLGCDGCVLEIARGSHMSFGPQAKNVHIRGLFFQGAKSSSLLFHYDGADVFFEECLFAYNVALQKQLGTVADLNSTSFVSFSRCLMLSGTSDKPGSTTSLSIRTRDSAPI